MNRMRVVRRVGLAAASALVVAAAFQGAALAAGNNSTASLSGTVTDASDHSDLGGISVLVTKQAGSTWQSVTGATTDDDGTWTVPDLAAGTYRVAFSDDNCDYTEQYWDGSDTADGAESITLAAGEAKDGIDGDLSEGASISGTVTDSDGDAVPDTSVTVYGYADGEWTNDGSSSTDEDGEYTVDCLLPGTHTVAFAQGDGAWQTVWLGQKSDIADATTINLSRSGESDGNDATLQAVTQPEISGTVSGPSGGAPGIDVSVYSAGAKRGDDPVTTTTTTAGGNFSVTGLADGSYTVGYADPSDTLATAYYGGASLLSKATYFTVSADDPKPDADATLAKAGTVEVSGKGVDEVDLYDADGLADAVQMSNGTATIAGLAAGSYQVKYNQGQTVTDGDYAPGAVTAAVKVSAGRSTSLSIAGELGGTLSGKLADDFGGCDVTAEDVAGVNPDKDVLLGDDGSFSVAGLASGSYHLVLEDGCNGVDDPQYLSENGNDGVTTDSAQADAFDVQAQVTGWPGAAVTARVGQKSVAAGVVIAPSTAAVAYQWYWGGTHKIAGATRSSLSVVPAEAYGHELSVRVAATATGDEALSGTYTVVKKVGAGVFTAPTPRVTGSARVGSTLKASAGAWTPTAKVGYQWFANGKKIAGATRATYRITAAQAGRRITVVVTGKASGYSTLAKRSVATATVRR